jgi:iron complex transport system ATP-binding protein
MAEWHIESLSVRLAGRTVVDAVSATISPGELVVLVGANGAGKSSLLRAGLGLLPAASGTSRIGAADPARMRPQERARQVAYLPQSRPLAWPLSVADVVALGRFSHGVGGGRLAADDQAAIARALAATSLTNFASRRTDQLSGGELARVHLARALAAEAPLLAADEPTAGLDPAQALAVMETLKSYCAKGGAALVILHDLALAARFADRVLVMAEGRLIASGPPEQALSPKVLATAFGLRGQIAVVEGTPVLAVHALRGQR